jgi:aldehyde dehydrogenase (NAD+)
VYAHIARGRAAEIDAAVRAAQQALDGEWGRMTATERGRVLMKLANLVQDHAQELAAIEARDTGKALATAMIDMEVLARYFEFYGAGADKVHGQVIPFLNGYTVTVLREPLGVTGHIIPWNYPAQMFGRTCAPALAMGNACVVKPAEDACLSILRIAELALEAGLPPGALNIVTGYGEEAGAALSAHPGLGLVSFTGSSEVGSSSVASRRRSSSTMPISTRRCSWSCAASCRTRGRPVPQAVACSCNAISTIASSSAWPSASGSCVRAHRTRNPIAVR